MLKAILYHLNGNSKLYHFSFIFSFEFDLQGIAFQKILRYGISTITRMVEIFHTKIVVQKQKGEPKMASFWAKARLGLGCAKMAASGGERDA